MQKEIRSEFVVLAISIVVAIVAFFYYRAAQYKPPYPGLMAGKPGQGPMQPPTEEEKERLKVIFRMGGQMGGQRPSGDPPAGPVGTPKSESAVGK